MTAAFVLVDVDCRLDRARLADVAEAATIHATRDFGREPPAGWGAAATVRLGASPADVRPGEVVVALLSHPDVAGALGYHDRTPAGHPVIKVFPLLDALENLGITVTHEIDETLADPELSRASVGADGVVRACEPGDPVEALSYPITVCSGRAVLVTDFVTPAYFEPPDDLHGVPLDFLGRVLHPGEILPGGYQLVYAPGKGWSEVAPGAKRAYRAALDAHGLGRNARRATHAPAAG